jgi:hypothetical protein
MTKGLVSPHDECVELVILIAGDMVDPEPVEDELRV